jgi:hypothetical protein
LALGLALALLGGAGAATADSGASPMVTATIYASDGATSTVSVSSSQLLADPQDCPAYSSSEMEEQSSSGTNPVGLPDEHGAGTGTWTLPTILGCMTPTVAVSDVTGITVISGDGTPESGPDSELTPADPSAGPATLTPTTR